MIQLQILKSNLKSALAALCWVVLFSIASPAHELPDSLLNVQTPHKRVLAHEAMNPISLVLSLCIRVYQNCFSSLDGPSCQFSPSCAAYGREALRKYGPVQGVLMTSDRLLRCNPYTQGFYFQAEDHIHLHDPVEDHALAHEKSLHP